MKPEFRGMGLSKMLFSEVEHHMKEQIGETANWVLTTSIFNKIALNLYKKKGFKVVKIFNEVLFFGLLNVMFLMLMKRDS